MTVFAPDPKDDTTGMQWSLLQIGAYYYPVIYVGWGREESFLLDGSPVEFLQKGDEVGSFMNEHGHLVFGHKHEAAAWFSQRFITESICPEILYAEAGL